MAFFRPLSLVLASVSMFGSARADEPVTVRVAGSCMPLGTSADEVLRMLEAELAPVRVLHFTGSETAGPGDAILAVDACADDPLGARVSIIRHGERRERFVALSDAAPGALNRTFSLALAEASRDPAFTVPAAPVWPAQLSVRLAPPGPASELPTPAREPDPGALTPRASVLFRFMPASSTPALGVEGGLGYRHLTAGLVVLAARGTDALGSATLVAVAGTASYDVLDLGASVTARVAGELGVAIGIPSPNEAAAGRTQAALHAGLLAGLASAWPLGMGYALRGFAGGGFASSLNAEADGRNLGSLGGGLVTLAVGVGFPE